MTRYVIGPDVAMRLARDQMMVRDGNQLLAPTLLRSQLLSLLFQAVRRGEMTNREANQRLDFVRGLRIRLLGDRVLQNVAWKVAEQLGWSDTLDAEYVALTQLQADALITLDRRLARSAKDLVVIAPNADSRAADSTPVWSSILVAQSVSAPPGDFGGGWVGLA